jgi:hypothetical protein
VKPVLQALVLAEHVYQDISGKKIIAGTFTAVNFTTRPLEQIVKAQDGGMAKRVPGGMHGGSPYAYLSLTDVADNTELVLQFVNLNKNTRIFGSNIIVKSSDRLATIEIVLPLPYLGIREAGAYAFEVICEGEILGSYRISAKEFDRTPLE